MRKNNKYRYETGFTVYKRDGEDVENMLRRLKKKILKDGFMQELKLRQSFEKPSDKRNRKMRETLKKLKRAAKLEKMNNRRSD